jgi:putative oxidoreductase
MKILSCSCGNGLQDLAPFVLRVAAGLIFLVHGWQKLGMGVDGVAGMLGSLGFPLPVLMALVLIFAELVGGIMLIVGLFTHWVAKVLAFVALVAWLTVHASKGFLISAGGFEFIMLIFAATVAIAILGPGRWSVDRALRK